MLAKRTRTLRARRSHPSRERPQASLVPPKTLAHRHAQGDEHVDPRFSRARHTKRWMLACWREGIVPLLQMHDSLDCSARSPKQAEMVARLGCEAVTLEVPMRVDLAYGHNWGDAKQTWEELHAKTGPHVES